MNSEIRIEICTKRSSITAIGSINVVNDCSIEYLAEVGARN